MGRTVAFETQPGSAHAMRILLRLLKAILLVLLVFWVGGLVLFRFLDPPATPLMVIRSIERGSWVSYRPVQLSAINPALARAVIASEDARFCFHRGIDLGAVQEALDDYEETGRLRGASTITMQVARNLFLWPGGGFVRKAIEVPMAVALDFAWPPEPDGGGADRRRAAQSEPLECISPNRLYRAPDQRDSRPDGAAEPRADGLSGALSLASCGPFRC
jgi:hypothetical protein